MATRKSAGSKVERPSEPAPTPAPEPAASEPPRVVEVPEPKVEEPKLTHEYQVAPGKSLLCAKGTLCEGDEVKAKWLGGRPVKGESPEACESRGRKSLGNLVSKGVVLKR